MTGLPEFNQSSFNKAARILREVGYFVFNPVENDAEAGIVLDGTEGVEDFDFHSAMARDLEQVCKSDVIFVLPGYEYSTGAEIECWVAHRMGIPVYSVWGGYYNDYVFKIAPPRIEAHEFHTHKLNPGEVSPSLAQVFPIKFVKSELRKHDSAGFGVDEQDASLSIGPPGFYKPGTPERELAEKVSLQEHPLPIDSAARKAIPITTGVIDYFPAALVAVAQVSKAGNDKHNPGEALHWSRGKSTDQADAIARHLIERGGIDPDTGQRYTAQLAWRALALLQIELEEAGEAPVARGAR